MNPTPRTDAFLERDHVAWDGMWVQFARELESELADARNELARIAGICDANQGEIVRLHRIRCITGEAASGKAGT